MISARAPSPKIHIPLGAQPLGLFHRQDCITGLARDVGPDFELGNRHLSRRLATMVVIYPG